MVGQTSPSVGSVQLLTLFYTDTAPWALVFKECPEGLILMIFVDLFCWDHFGTILGSCWNHSGIILGEERGVQGLRKRSGPVGGKNRIPAGGFGVTRVTAMEDPPWKEENAALAGVGGLSGESRG